MLLAAADGASVRDLERMAAAAKKAKTAAKKPAEPKPTFYSEVELSLKNEMHRKVHINPSGNGKGTLTIEFLSDDELAEFAKKLSETTTMPCGHPISVRTEIGEKTVGNPFDWVPRPS